MKIFKNLVRNSSILIVCSLSLASYGLYNYYSKYNIINASSHEKLISSLENINSKISVDERNKLSYAMQYLISKNSSDNNLYIKIFLNKLNNETYEKLLDGKKYTDIIKEAKDLAIKENITNFNTENLKKFYDSYYAMMLTNEKESSDELLDTAILIKLRILSLVIYPELTNGNYITDVESYSIINNIANRQLKEFKNKSVKDINGEEIINNGPKLSNEDLELTRKIKNIIKTEFYAPKNNEYTIKRLTDSINYMKNAKENGQYSHQFSCEVKDFKSYDYKTTDQTVDGVSFTTFDFIADNKKNSFDGLSYFLVLKDKNSNYYLQKGLLNSNNLIVSPTRVKAVPDILMVKNENIKAHELAIYKVIPFSCYNKITRSFNDKDSLNKEISEAEVELSKLKQKQE